MIYILRTKNITPSYLKVGYTNRDINKRIKSIQTGCPFELELVEIKRGSKDKEKQIHSLLAGHKSKIRGEWFHDNVEVRGLLRIREPGQPEEAKEYSDRQKDILKILFENRGRSLLLTEFCYLFSVAEEELSEMARDPRSSKVFELETIEHYIISAVSNFQGPAYKGKRAIIWIFRNFCPDKL